MATTVYRAKGLEWNTVMLHEDFQDPDSLDYGPKNEERRRDELNLLYVAATRARKTLVLRQILANSRFTG